MYRFYLNKIENDYHYAEMCRVFLDESEFETIGIDLGQDSKICLREGSYLLNAEGTGRRDTIKRELYNLLKDLTGSEPEWGTMTGVRPLKLALDKYKELGSIEKLNDCLSTLYLMSDRKIKLLDEIIDYQLKHVEEPDPAKLSLYVGIPFCPTRCAYCSFASNVADEGEIAKYLENLYKEIRYTGELNKESSKAASIESIYIGGGTPTTLNAKQLERLIDEIATSFDIKPSEIEFTVEAGRPDTITADKLQALKDKGISRISINPQTMKDDTLKLIGRNHSAEDITKAYDAASKYGFEIINADIIAGLPEEDYEDFVATLEKVIGLGANNITVHTLSVKRGSKMKDEDPSYYRRNAKVVARMLEYAHDRLIAEGFYPYYIYKQKHQIGAFENIGYCKENTHSLYNIRIMEEKQTIIALGAGAIGKVYFPSEDRLERIPNVANYRVYDERFDEMLRRKNLYYGG